MIMTVDSVPIVGCYGGNTYVNVDVNGGTRPYTVSDGTSSETGSNNFYRFTETPGTYTLTVTDVNGSAASKSATISQPAPVTAGITGQTNGSTYGGRGRPRAGPRPRHPPRAGA